MTNQARIERGGKMSQEANQKMSGDVRLGAHWTYSLAADGGLRGMTFVCIADATILPLSMSQIYDNTMTLSRTGGQWGAA